jgi:hypothetical protein
LPEVFFFAAPFFAALFADTLGFADARGRFAGFNFLRALFFALVDFFFVFFLGAIGAV